MALKLSSLKADTRRETEGDWIESPDLPGVEFKVSSLLLETYQVERDNLIRKLSKQYNNKVPQSVVVPEIGKLYAKHILHDWRGLDVSYSRAKAEEVLGDYEYRAVVAAVEWCAAKISETNIEFDEDEIKNSEKPSAKGSAKSA